MTVTVTGKLDWDAAARRERARIGADRPLDAYHEGCGGRWFSVKKIHGRPVQVDPRSGVPVESRICERCHDVEVWDSDRGAWAVSRTDMSRRVKSWMGEVRRAGYAVELENGMWKVRHPDTGGLLFTCSPNIGDTRGLRNAQTQAQRAGIDWTRKRKTRASGGEPPPPPIGEPVAPPEEQPDPEPAPPAAVREPGPGRASPRRPSRSVTEERDMYNADLRERLLRALDAIGGDRGDALMFIWEIGREKQPGERYPAATAKDKRASILRVMSPLLDGGRPDHPFSDQMRLWWDTTLRHVDAELGTAKEPLAEAMESLADAFSAESASTIEPRKDNQEEPPMPTAPPTQASPRIFPMPPLPSVQHTVATDPTLALRTMKRMMRLAGVSDDHIDEIIGTGADLLGIDGNVL